MLRKLRLWAPLDAADEQALLELPNSIVTIEKGKRALITEGDAVTHCWVVLRGYCVRYKIVGDGGRHIFSIHMKGDLVDLQNALLGVADHGVQAIAACKMAKILIEAIRALCDARPAEGTRSGTIRWWMARSIGNGWRMWDGAMEKPALRISSASSRSSLKR